MAKFKKTDVEMHSDGYGWSNAHPAIDVKVHGRLGASIDDVVEKFGCSKDQAEKALEMAFDAECHSFWEYWCDPGSMGNGLTGSPEYAYFPHEKVTVECQGRSGGWLVVKGLPPVEEWDAVMVSRWAKFQRHVLADMEFHISKEALLEAINMNQWWKEHSEPYNFYEKSNRESVCMADVKADVIAYALDKWGIVPTLP